VCLPTQTSPHSSTESGIVIDLEPERSRLLVAWWIALHLLLLGVAAYIPGPMAMKLCGALLVPLHAAARWPSAPPRVVCYRDGAWAVPELGLAGLRLGGRTRYTTLWVRLSLVASTRALDIVLLVDQLDVHAWRRLQVSLRSGADRAAVAPGSPRGSAKLR